MTFRVFGVLVSNVTDAEIGFGMEFVPLAENVHVLALALGMSTEALINAATNTAALSLPGF